MAEPRKPDSAHLVNTLGVIGVIVAVLNVAFFLLSSNYYAGRPMYGGNLNSVRIAFAVASLSVGAMSFAASLQPRLVAHALGAIAGAAGVAGGVEALSHGMPPVLGLTMVIVGVTLAILTWLSYEKRSRVAWSFLASLVIVFALVTFFGAPKVRNMLHIGLWYAMIIPGMLVVCAVALALLRFEYRDQIPSQKSQSAAR